MSVRGLANLLRAEGEAIGLPLVATCADISSARPSLDEYGEPVAENLAFTSAGSGYWQTGDLALQNAIVGIVRNLAEPFYYDEGRIGGWRSIEMPAALARKARERDYAVRSAIVVPVRLPRSTIGAVVWASDAAGVDVEAVFAAHALQLLGLALRFILACDALAHGPHEVVACALTRREVQCLKLVAAGKTDGEIATILGLSTPTIRFHMKKAGGKLGEAGRLRTAQRAVELGYVSTRL